VSSLNIVLNLKMLILASNIYGINLCSRISVVEKDVEELLLSDFGGKKIGLFIGEPYFSNNMLPWHRYVLDHH
jgi:hypothetical protein